MTAAARAGTRSVPGADDDSAIRAVDAAHRQLIGATRSVELPDRYAVEPGPYTSPARCSCSAIGPPPPALRCVAT